MDADALVSHWNRHASGAQDGTNSNDVYGEKYGDLLHEDDNKFVLNYLKF